MRLKSYFAPSVDEAIERARTELGPDAMLLNSRKIAAEQAHLGAYEVVFGITGETLQRKPAPAPGGPRPSAFAVGHAARSAAASAAAAPAASVAPAASAAPKTAPAPIVLPVPAAPVQAISPRVDLAALTAAPGAAPAKPGKRQARKSATRAKSSAEKPAKPAPANSAKPVIADELAELRKQIQAVQKSLVTTGSDTRSAAEQAASEEEVFQQLVNFDFSERVAKRFVETARVGSGDTSSTARLAGILVDEINARFDVSPRVGREGSDRRVVMFVGPPGAGKTTTIVKLAVKLGIQRRIPVQLVSLDTMRVGGSEQLAEYARIIGVDFRALYSTAALDEVLRDCAGKKLILIDTPGYAPAEMDEAEENAYFLGRHPEIEVQLVLPASLRASAFDKFSERFAVFQPTKLLFTHLDEVETFGPLLEHAMKTKLPVSYLTDGQTIPSDIEEASKERLTEGLFPGLAQQSVSAA